MGIINEIFCDSSIPCVATRERLDELQVDYDDKILNIENNLNYKIDTYIKRNNKIIRKHQWKNGSKRRK